VVTVALFSPHAPPGNSLVIYSVVYLFCFYLFCIYFVFRTGNGNGNSHEHQNASPPHATFEDNTNHKNGPLASSPPPKQSNRNSISLSLMNFITPGHSSKSSSQKPPIISKSPPESTSTSLSTTPTSVPTYSDITASTSPSPSNMIATSPPSQLNTQMGTKKGVGSTGSLRGSSVFVDLLADDQLVYIVTADASGQIKVFENFVPLSSSSLSPITSPTVSPPSTLPPSPTLYPIRSDVLSPL
jgi:hypothetical protein